MERLADLNINLIPSSKRTRVPKHTAGAFVMLFLLLLLFTYFYISQHKILVNQQAENENLKASLESFRREEKIYEPVKIMDQAIYVKRKEIETLTKNRLPYAEVMNEIDRIRPEAIIIVGAEINSKRVILNGYSPDLSEISRMLENAKSSSGLADVALLTSEKNETTDEVKFTLEIEREAAQ